MANIYDPRTGFIIAHGEHPAAPSIARSALVGVVWFVYMAFCVGWLFVYVSVKYFHTINEDLFFWGLGALGYIAVCVGRGHWRNARNAALTVGPGRE